MKVKVGLCQLMPVPEEPAANAERILRCLDSGKADVYVFPELFLTGYGADYTALREETESCLVTISEKCRETDTAAAVSTPRYAGDRIYNSMAFMSPDGDVWYDKVHLANFGIYAETMFTPGERPASACMGSYHGMRFGMCICYDIFFPEVLHGCSLNGADVNVCVAASAVGSKPFLDKVVGARALENVSYLAYVNNTGPLNGLEMHGCSRGLDPFGDVICECGTEEWVSVFTADTDELAEARSVRRHLTDFRDDVDWLGRE